ncbi:hypothetical protein GCM10007103_32990 [Salinimicrobium marinum]|uniref:Lipoprotein n=1 Tax=Salinimicrobium marinum TaxID=680283 RepID=A0A918SKT3_9FLAO|nr:hypothetical protein [Salinimicrobium marinum]GHA49527.1 hypothetical protein GCM10007103_32990 [Salinimicrobium marinum]
MTKFHRLAILLIGSVFSFGCSSDDDNCMKTIIVQYEQVIQTPTGTAYLPEVTQEVPCDTPEPDPVQEIEEPGFLENFDYEVVSFNFTPDTGNNTSRLQFEIILKNRNNFSVTGVPVLTTVADGLKTSGSFSAQASSPCYEIDANGSCTLIYDQEYSLDQGLIESLELKTVQYFVAE